MDAIERFELIDRAHAHRVITAEFDRRFKEDNMPQIETILVDFTDRPVEEASKAHRANVIEAMRLHGADVGESTEISVADERDVTLDMGDGITMEFPRVFRFTAEAEPLK